MSTRAKRVALGAVILCVLGCGGSAARNGEVDSEEGAPGGSAAGGSSAGSTSNSPATGGSESPGAGAPAGGTTAAVVGGTAGRGSGGFADCAASEQPATTSYVALGFGRGFNQGFQGTLAAVAALELVIDSADGPRQFVWQGPPLINQFDVGEAVTVDAYSAFGGLSPTWWAIVRGSKATVATLEGTSWASRATEVGARAPVTAPVTFPTLTQVNLGCCSAGAMSFCDYSQLDVKLDDMQALIGRHETGEVGGWSVTNFGATYSQGGEYTTSMKLTLLGPATTDPATPGPP